MLDSMTLKDILDLGTNGLLVVFLGMLWARLNKVTDILIENGRQAAAERVVIARQAGLTTQTLHDEAQVIRRRFDHEKTG